MRSYVRSPVTIRTPVFNWPRLSPHLEETAGEPPPNDERIMASSTALLTPSFFSLMSVSGATSRFNSRAELNTLQHLLLLRTEGPFTVGGVTPRRVSLPLHEKALSVNGRRGGPPLLLTYLFRRAIEARRTSWTAPPSALLVSSSSELGAC